MCRSKIPRRQYEWKPVVIDGQKIAGAEKQACAHFDVASAGGRLHIAGVDALEVLRNPC